MMSCLKEHIDDETVEGSHVFVSVSLYCGRFYGQRFLFQKRHMVIVISIIPLSPFQMSLIAVRVKRII